MVQVDQLFPRSISVWDQYWIYIYVCVGKLQITVVRAKGPRGILEPWA